MPDRLIFMLVRLKVPAGLPARRQAGAFTLCRTRKMAPGHRTGSETAIASLGAASPAWAQNSVTLYGVLDEGIDYTNSNYKNPTGNGYIGIPLAAPGVALNTLKYQNFEVNGKYQFTPAFYVGAQYVYTMENYDASSGSVNPKIHSFGLMADYNFTKRTDVYVQGEYQKVAGDSTNSILDKAFIPGMQAPSSTGNQVAVRVALRHKFQNANTPAV
ncbi:hypothetical protein LMG31841_04620 [Paraburkholderia saeva]|uniref:Porin domain-containing protein n=1 Tax=Paraburkholderia saeva TaxID=2777537 RepID=A0A9N8S164_9BURK|nr:hypothetical protein LMG31841_04620 [Paraburkholderia saeva]